MNGWTQKLSPVRHRENRLFVSNPVKSSVFLKPGHQASTPFPCRVNKVSNDCVVVDLGGGHHVKVPDGVGKGNPSVQLEKYDSAQVDHAAQFQLGQPYVIHLQRVKSK